MKILNFIFLVAVFLLLGGLCEAQIERSNTEIRYLSGKGNDDAVLWDFFCTEGRNSGVWTKIRVPANWETEGFGIYQYGGDRQGDSFPKEQGKYKLNFEAPQRWHNRVVRLVFEGAMTDTEVRINGKSAGPIHQGSFYRFKFDITPLLKFGESNLLEVTVSKESTNSSVNGAERMGDYWNFGGIFRPVYIEVLPPSFIDWTAIDARADGTFRVHVNFEGDVSNLSRVVGQIIDRAGRPTGQTFSANVNNTRSVTLGTTILRPKLWTAETPNLYRLRLNLIGKSGSLHRVTERFGFRTFEVRKGDGLYLNGQRILLKGVNRHSFWPDTGRALSKQVSYDDVKLIKEMNMNAVRMSHYPPDAHFLEVCDELGLYVLDELAGWHRFYDKATGQRLIGQMIRRDVNHPSILFWDNGNEGGWNVENDDEFAKWDPQKREVLHPWEKFRLVNTDHYEKFDSHTRLVNGPDIYMPTEFLHGLYDGGIGAGMLDYWDLIRKSKVGGGGFFWALVDECVKRTDQNGRLDCAGNRGPDGIVGPHREKEGSFNTVREIWSPLVLEASLHGLSIDFKVENRYDFLNLNSCTFEWSVGKFPLPNDGLKGHKTVVKGVLRAPNVGPHQTGRWTLRLPLKATGADVLYLTASDPTGHEIWTWSWKLRPTFLDAQSVRRAVQVQETTSALTIQNGHTRLNFNKDTGTLDRVTDKDRELPIGNGPQPIVYRRSDRTYNDIAGANRLTHFETRKEEGAVIIEASFDGALKRVRWRISAGGVSGLLAQLDYEIAYDGVVDILGVKFSSSEDQIRSIRWLGMGPYRVWQNRLEGTHLDVWENAYNDSTPGENWAFPEFKGYFREFQWARFETTGGPFILSSLSSNSYLGLFKPKDGVNGLLDFPDVGIAVLEVIPAMRNKFHNTDEIGPQSKAKTVSGITKHSVQFRFGN